MGTDQLSLPDDGGDAETMTIEEYRRLPASTRNRTRVQPKPKKPSGKASPHVRHAQGFRCRKCGEENIYLAKAEQHARETGHARIECVS